MAVYDNLTKHNYIFNEHDIEDCVLYLNDADVLISFNGREFDTPTLESTAGITVLPEQYDILHEVWKALGERRKGYRLSEICARLELGEKTSDGARATEMYEDGEFQRLYRYCRNDVELTRNLCNFINSNGYILAPDGSPLPMPQLGMEI